MTTQTEVFGNDIVEFFSTHATGQCTSAIIYSFGCCSFHCVQNRVFSLKLVLLSLKEAVNNNTRVYEDDVTILWCTSSLHVSCHLLPSS